MIHFLALQLKEQTRRLKQDFILLLIYQKMTAFYEHNYQHSSFKTDTWSASLKQQHRERQLDMCKN